MMAILLTNVDDAVRIFGTTGRKCGNVIHANIQSRVPSLLREVRFRRYWSGTSISLLGDQVSSIALPLVAVIDLQSSPAQMGILVAFLWIPSLLFGLHAGTWADTKPNPIRIMVIADLVRAGLLASVLVAFMFGDLTIWQMYAVVFALGTFSVLFSVCAPGVFVALVVNSNYVEGNSLLYGSRALAFVFGPGVGGLLVEALNAPIALVADACSYLGSAFFLSGIRSVETVPSVREKGMVRAGVTVIFRSAVLRPSLSALAIVNFFYYMFAALFVLYVTRSLEVTPGTLGLIFASEGVGGVIGVYLTRRIVERYGVGRVYTYGTLVFSAPLILVPLAQGARWVIIITIAVAQVASGLGVMAQDISVGAILLETIPDKVRARVNGAIQAVSYGARPLGALVGGFLGTLVGARATLWIATVGGTGGFVVLFYSPLRRFRISEKPRSLPEIGLTEQTD